MLRNRKRGGEEKDSFYFNNINKLWRCIIYKFHKVLWCYHWTCLTYLSTSFCVFPGCQLCTISYLGTLSCTDIAERWWVDRLWCHLCWATIYLFFRLGLWRFPYAFISWSFSFILFGMGGTSWSCDLLSFAKLGKQTALISSNIGPPILYIPLTRMPAK